MFNPKEFNPHQQDCIEVLIEKTRRGQIDRRTFLKGMGLMAALPLALRSGVSFAAGDKPLVVVNWGGDAIKAFGKAWTEGFSKATGIPTKIDGSGPTEGAIRTQLSSGRVSWDVVDAESSILQNLGKEGLVQPIDYNVVSKDKVLPGFAYEYGIADYMLSYVIAYDSERFGDKAPKTWADFWDVKTFPGKRTLYKWMNGMLEAALLADGVAPDKLYPLDVPRALKKIEELKPHVLAFWGSGAETQQLLIEGEVSMGAIWNTRAQVISEDSEDRIKWTFDNALLGCSNWGVLKGNPAGTEAAMKFIAYAQDPQSQVELFKMFGNGPANPAAAALIPDDRKHLNCTDPANLPKQIMLSHEWYTDHYAATLEQYLTHISK
ncbi:ABC transporter substrate-binding protein [Pseudomonas nicosulfuronedens]|uniref:ABC transporter substrate-binding protein n=1 Tax=Pseudomonas nicosulfuronedens TaxID=2571105 RepID=A0A5R9R7E6_9PSED|nr:ABC transporter substrate-binding protein [Pseudomonas nicosulfuronedens]MDH1010166.1 ABC transporter substrate-binding protein [Pseudomonas nicosulfuronedens]MDH1980182.1 ABC transporter substrate-binding protein [Pseudomonas nicosulfuronedens]MDH2025401.1 ABC transporter substrate-binding protein [Pseudomonas nicosulfuronedens]TLX78807.1 ABC transporter substrate-binding protein [Pseudomonas nicosulfuronedens]